MPQLVVKPDIETQSCLFKRLDTWTHRTTNAQAQKIKHEQFFEFPWKFYFLKTLLPWNFVEMLTLELQGYELAGNWSFWKVGVFAIYFFARILCGSTVKFSLENFPKKYIFKGLFLFFAFVAKRTVGLKQH